MSASVMDAPGAREAMDALVASAPPATPEQIALVNRVFRPTTTRAGSPPLPGPGTPPPRPARSPRAERAEGRTASA